MKKKTKTFKLKEDNYGMIELDGKKFKFKKYDSQRQEAVLELIEDEKEFKTKFDRVVCKLSRYINKKTLMTEVLREFPKDELYDLHDRIFKKKQPIKTRRGCHSIMVGRKEIWVGG